MISRPLHDRRNHGDLTLFLGGYRISWWLKQNLYVLPNYSLSYYRLLSPCFPLDKMGVSSQ